MTDTSREAVEAMLARLDRVKSASVGEAAAMIRALSGQLEAARLVIEALRSVTKDGEDIDFRTFLEDVTALQQALAAWDVVAAPTRNNLAQGD